MNENYSLPRLSLPFPRACLVVAFDLVPSGNRDLTQNTTEQEEEGGGGGKPLKNYRFRALKQTSERPTEIARMNENFMMFVNGMVLWTRGKYLVSHSVSFLITR
jgi:hypothetical protein